MHIFQKEAIKSRFLIGCVALVIKRSVRSTNFIQVSVKSKTEDTEQVFFFEIKLFNFIVHVNFGDLQKFRLFEKHNQVSEFYDEIESCLRQL